MKKRRTAAWFAERFVAENHRRSQSRQRLTGVIDDHEFGTRPSAREELRAVQWRERIALAAHDERWH